MQSFWLYNYASQPHLRTGDCKDLSYMLSWKLLNLPDFNARIEIVKWYPEDEEKWHVCLVVNRETPDFPSPSLLPNPRIWNKDAIIADPWHKIIFKAEQNDFFKPLFETSTFGNFGNFIKAETIFDSFQLPKNWKAELKEIKWICCLKNQHSLWPLYDLEMAKKNGMSYELL